MPRVGAYEMPTWERALFSLLLLGATVLFVWITVTIDLFGGGAIHTWGSLFLIVFAVPAVLCLAVLRSKAMNAAFGVVLALAFLSIVIPWHPKKRFVNDLLAVEPGMTTDDVFSRMKGYSLRVDGDARYWAARNQLVHSADRQLTYSYERWGGNTGRVALREGRVVAVEFSPD